MNAGWQSDVISMTITSSAAPIEPPSDAILVNAMLKTLTDLFNALKPQAAEQSDPEHQLQLATAVLLVEVSRSDSNMSQLERRSAFQTLQEKFALTEDEVARLFELAEREASEAHDLHRFTSRINAGFNDAQKLRIIQNLWRVVFADGQLSAHENHLMRRVADLLHVRPGVNMVAKLRAEAEGRE